MSEAERLKTLNRVINRYYKRIHEIMDNFPPHTQINLLTYKQPLTVLQYIHDITWRINKEPLTLIDLVITLQELNLFISEEIEALLEDEKK
jgi:hypothetical protein